MDHGSILKAATHNTTCEQQLTQDADVPTRGLGFSVNQTNDIKMSQIHGTRNLALTDLTMLFVCKDNISGKTADSFEE